MDDDLAKLVTGLTPMQQRFLLTRVQGNYRHDQDVARAVGIHPQTVYNWRHEYPAFVEAEQALGEEQIKAVQWVLRVKAAQQAAMLDPLKTLIKLSKVGYPNRT